MARADECVILRSGVGATKYIFRPGQLELATAPRYEVNEVVGVAESGAVKIARLSTAIQTWYEFRVKSLKSADATVGSVLYRGFASLDSFVTSVADYRRTAVQLKLAGLTDSDGNYISVRFWDSTIPVTLDPDTPDSYSGKIVFRKEV